jgi:hypothetical protein
MNALEFGTHRLQQFRSEATQHDQLGFLRLRRIRRLRHALRTLVRVAFEEIMGTPAMAVRA